MRTYLPEPNSYQDLTVDHGARRLHPRRFTETSRMGPGLLYASSGQHLRRSPRSRYR
jgi:hypothetical protein